MIEDEELREIYKTSSEEHLQVLEAGLLGLEKNPEAINKIEELLREAHSLKGDSRIVGVESVEQIAHGIEDILKSIENQEITFTSAISDRLYGALDAMKLLVKAAVTGNPSGVELSKILASLQVRESEAPAPLKEEKIVPVIKIIEDEELREIYKTSCEEHLEKLEAGLLHLEKHPDDLERLEELMREAHSLKGDSRITEVESVEQLAQAVEDIFRSITKQELELTAKLSDRLDQVFNGMKKLVEEAVTGNPPQVNVSEMLTELRGEKFNVLSKKPAVEHKQQKNLVKTPESTHHIDTIRIQTRELDALMTQAGELTVTKIRIGHFASEMETAASLWEDWKNNRQQDQTISSEEKLEKLLSQLKNTAQENSARLDLISGELESKIRTLRLLPLATVFNLFPRMVRDLAKEEGKEVELIIEGGETTADKQILEEIKDPLMHMVRNAIDHGIETPEEREKLGKQRQATLRLRGYQIGNKIHIEVIDDGRGLEIEKIKQTALMRGICRPEELETMTESQLHHLIFVPGFSTKNFITEVSGRGVGLDVVRTNVERLKGNIEIESVFTQGCTFRIKLGTTLATANVLLVEVEGIVHALPLEVVQSNLLIKPEQIFTIEGRQTISLNNQAISVANLAELLQLSPMNGNKNKRSVRPCVLLNVGEEQLGVFVERVLDIQDVVIKPQSKLLKRVRNVSGATILGTGEVCMILNPQDLLASVHNGKNTTNFFERRITETEEKTKPVVLLADDSIAVRTQEKRILDGAGYEVITAVDGLDALNKLKTRDFDAVISDIQMPNLDGFLLTAKIRQHPEYNELPVILVTSLSSDEDKRKGVEVGANAYIVKGNFNQDILLETLGRLV
ncbi:MAG: hybrid sensor histidine kinase/response regulator [Gomphosphaeria aponina SAG 52.96 = DSM 107014]|uniref:histidine kinase n=1 Tax=Gomphosphaeria aponina SAG 52.96 = DSM 107014 TaxID=1521640 RepID=A0A941GPV0_9CHRO|nr:hybrid sensor histidine kinase/response regulator [Gomphosphaeria aponina SAG 52.96 = DSM 107014]